MEIQILNEDKVGLQQPAQFGHILEIWHMAIFFRNKIHSCFFKQQHYKCSLPFLGKFSSGNIVIDDVREEWQ